MSQVPTFSIILITHNRPARLVRAIDSVRAQLYENWELIVVDDGSVLPVPAQLCTDEARNRIQLTRNELPRGPSGARARGAELACAPWLCFLDDDDFYLPGHLQEMEALRRQFSDSPGRLYCTGLLRQDEHGRKPVDLSFLSASDQLLAYWKQPIGLPPFAIAREAVEACPIPVAHSVIEDFEWLCRLLATYRVRSTPLPTVVYTVDPLGRTLSLVDRWVLDQRESVVKSVYAQPAVRQRIPRGDYLRMLTHQRLHWTRQCIRAGQFREACHGLARGLTSARPRDWKEVMYTLYVLAARIVKTGPRSSPGE